MLPGPRAGEPLAGELSAMNDACADAPGPLPLFQKETIFSYRGIRFLLQIGLWQEPPAQGGGGGREAGRALGLTLWDAA